MRSTRRSIDRCNNNIGQVKRNRTLYNDPELVMNEKRENLYHVRYEVGGTVCANAWCFVPQRLFLFPIIFIFRCVFLVRVVFPHLLHVSRLLFCLTLHVFKRLVRQVEKERDGEERVRVPTRYETIDYHFPRWGYLDLFSYGSYRAGFRFLSHSKALNF